MSLLSDLLGVFRSKDAIALAEPPAAGEAQPVASNLITVLGEMQPKEVRHESTDDYLEAVIRGERLEEYSLVLAKIFGEPCKPLGVRPRFAGPLAKQVAAIGGVTQKQCLFLRRFEDDRVAYAALWPWSDPKSITLKVGVLD